MGDDVRTMRLKYSFGISASIVVGLIFLAAGLAKLLYPATTPRIVFTPFPAVLTPALTKFIITWLPITELILGLLLFFGSAAKLAAIFSLPLITAFVTNNSVLLARGLGSSPCDCFGVAVELFQVQLSIAGALYLDTGMLLLAVGILLCYPRGFFDVYPWLLTKGRTPSNSTTL